jgi:Zn-finger nucleic acid-binding protein
MELTPPGKIRCPKCATIMEKIQAAPGLEVEHCGRCGAMWFDAYELETALRTSGGTVHAIDYGSARTYDQTVHGGDIRECPRDHKPLLQIPDPRQPHIVIDLCKHCGGVLLDAGELKDLREFTIGERLRAFFKK